MFQTPNSVSVNTMCFLFHAGAGAVIVEHFLRRPKCKQSAEGGGMCGVLVSRCHKDVVWGQGPNFSGGKNSTRTWEGPSKPHAGGRECEPSWGVISFTFGDSGELLSQSPRQPWSSPVRDSQAAAPRTTTLVRDLWSPHNPGVEENKTPGPNKCRRHRA